MTVRIPLTRGMFALVDDADALLALPFKWHASPSRSTFYAVNRRSEQGRTLYLHRLILGLGHGDPDVDHVNGDGLDNRRANLRPATNSENQANKRRRSDNTSGFTGVSLDRRTGRWQAHIHYRGRSRHLGSFATPEAAARAYDAKATEIFGAFARVNFCEGGHQT